MKNQRLFACALVAVLLIAIGAGIAWQWRETGRLRAEREHARAAQSERRTLQADRERLRARQIPATELAQLRADHEALPRLRAEVEALRKGR